MRKRHSEEQIIKILNKVDEGSKVTDVCRAYGISQPTYYKWRSKYGGMCLSEVKRLRELEEENRRLKRLVADQALNIQALELVNSKKW